MSKAFAEELVHKCGFKLPVAVVRPSIIVGAHSEPFAGYIQGFQVIQNCFFMLLRLHNGISIFIQSTTGILAGFLSGIFRTALLRKDSHVRMIPVDFVVNSIIAVAWKRSSDETQKNECTFYNCTDSSSNQMTWRSLNSHLHRIYKRFVPYEKLLCFPSLFITGNFHVYTAVFFLTQFIPGMLFDIYLMLSGRKAL